MPGPVFPKKNTVWRGMTQDEIDLWQKKANRMLSTVAGKMVHIECWPAPGEGEDRYRRLKEKLDELYTRMNIKAPKYIWKGTEIDHE